MNKKTKKRRTQKRQARRSMKAKKRAGKPVKKLKGIGDVDVEERHISEILESLRNRPWESERKIEITCLGILKKKNAIAAQQSAVAMMTT